MLDRKEMASAKSVTYGVVPDEERTLEEEDPGSGALLSPGEQSSPHSGDWFVEVQSPSEPPARVAGDSLSNPKDILIEITQKESNEENSSDEDRTDEENDQNQTLTGSLVTSGAGGSRKRLITAAGSGSTAARASVSSIPLDEEETADTAAESTNHHASIYSSSTMDDPLLQNHSAAGQSRPNVKLSSTVAECDSSDDSSIHESESSMSGIVEVNESTQVNQVRRQHERKVRKKHQRLIKNGKMRLSHINTADTSLNHTSEGMEQENHREGSPESQTILTSPIGRMASIHTSSSLPASYSAVSSSSNGGMLMMDRCKRCLRAMYKNGDCCSMVISPILWASFIGMIITGGSEIWWDVAFVVLYLVYLCECRLSETWSYIKLKETGDGTVAILDALRRATPKIEWIIAAYHYEEYMSKKDDMRDVVVWVYGNREKHGHYLAQTGYQVEYFSSCYLAYSFLGNAENRRNVACIILPKGREALPIQRHIKDVFRDPSLNSSNPAATMTMNHSKSDLRRNNQQRQQTSAERGGGEKALKRDVPSLSALSTASGGNCSLTQLSVNELLFVQFDESRPLSLIDELLQKQMLVKHRRKVVTHTASMFLEFDEWIDTSECYPEWEHVFTKLEVQKSYNLMDDRTQVYYRDRQNEFIQSNKRDRQYEFNEVYLLDGFKEQIWVCSTKSRKHPSKRKSGDHDGIAATDHSNDDDDSAVELPFWMTPLGYWSYSVCMLTLLPRWKITKMTGEKSWTVSKCLKYTGECDGSESQ